MAGGGQVTLSKLGPGSSKRPEFHIFKWDVELASEQSFEPKLQDLSLAHEYCVLLKYAPVLVLVELREDLFLDLLSR